MSYDLMAQANGGDDDSGDLDSNVCGEGLISA